MTPAEEIRAECTKSALKFDAEARLETGLKKAKFEGAAKAYRLVAVHYAGLEIADLREAMNADAQMQSKAAHDVRTAFPEMAASFEGYAWAYKSVAKLCGRLIDQQASDLWNHDATREEGSYARQVRDYNADVMRGMQP